MEQNKGPTTVVGLFDEPQALVNATQKTREAGFKNFDAFTPYPVHGLDQAQGLKRSPIPYVTFIFGLTGCALGFLLQYWTSVIDWPLNVGGKPFNSWPAFVPIMFELTVLLGGLSTFAAVLFFCRIPNFTKKIVDPSITRDRFALVIEDAERTEEAKKFLQSLNAKEVKLVYPEGWF